MVSNWAVIVVSSKIGIVNKEVCNMHNRDKVRLSTTGTLTRNRNKKVINPFDAGVALLHLAMKVAAHFLYGVWLGDFHLFGWGYNAPKVKLKADLNGTQDAGHQQLLFLLLQLNHPLCLYQIHHPTSFEVTTEKWEEVGEVKGVLHITQLLTQQCHNTRHCIVQLLVQSWSSWCITCWQVQRLLLWLKSLSQLLLLWFVLTLWWKIWLQLEKSVLAEPY